MVEERPVTCAFVESISQHAPLRRAGGRIDHQPVAEANQLVMHHLVADARLDDGVGHFLVYLENAVHPPAKVHHDLATLHRGAASEPDVVAGAVGVDRDAVAGCGADHHLHLGCRGGVKHAVDRAAAAGHGVLAVSDRRLGGAVYRVGAKFALDLGKEGVGLGGVCHR